MQDVIKFYSIYNSVTTEIYPINTKDLSLSYELVEGQKFFKYKLSGSLKFQNNPKLTRMDYNYFKAIEQDSLCNVVNFELWKLCEDGNYVKKWSGVMNINKGIYDDDQCTVEYTADDVNQYDCLLSDNMYNVLEITDRVSTTFYRTGGSTIPNGILFKDVLNFIATQCAGILGVKSDFFQINPVNVSDYNYVTGEYNVYTNMVMYQITDYILPTPTQQALIGKLSWKKITDDLAELFNVWWTVEDGYVRLEHSSFFFTSVGLDLTMPQFSKYLVKKNKYEYINNNRYKYEEWEMTPALQGGRLTYKDECTSTSFVQEKLLHEIKYLYTEYGTVRGADDQRFYLVNCEIITGVYHTYGINENLNLGNLILRFFRNERFFFGVDFEYFTASDDDPTMLYDKSEKDYGQFRIETLLPTKLQKDLEVALCCADSDVDATKLIKSNLGEGIISEYSLNLVKNLATMSLQHGRTSVPSVAVSDIPDMAGWWKSDTGVTTLLGKVTLWRDQSGHHNDFIGDSGNEPGYTASVPEIKGLPSIDFGFAITSFMHSPSFAWAAAGTDYSYFIVTRPTFVTTGPSMLMGTIQLASGNVFALGIDDTGSGNLEFQNYITDKNWKLTNELMAAPGNYPYPDSWTLFNEIRENDKSHGWHGGKRHRKTANSNPMDHSVPVDPGPLYLGAEINGSGNPVFNSYFNGSVAEIIFFNRKITELERQYVEQYLFRKYAYLNSYTRF